MEESNDRRMAYIVFRLVGLMTIGLMCNFVLNRRGVRQLLSAFMMKETTASIQLGLCVRSVC